METNIREADTISEALKRFGTPLFLFSEKQLEEDYVRIRSALPQQVGLYYSMKANPNPYICKAIHRLGSPIEVASIGEYHRAVSIGVPADQIVFTGPGKSREEIRACIDGDVFCINAESVQELTVIQEEAARLKKKVQVTLRINLKTTRQGSRMASVGIPTQFGIDEEQLEDAVKYALGHTQLKLIGLHTYQGTQNFHLDYYKESIPGMFAWIRKLKDIYAIPLTTVGLGGGFGVPYFRGDDPFPIDEFGKLLSEEILKNEDLQLKHIFVESGRYITSRMGSYVTQVLYTKQSHGKKFVIVDGGTHHRAFSSVMGRSFKAPLPIRYMLHDRKDEMLEEPAEARDGFIQTNIVGKLCTPTDVIQSSVLLPGNMTMGDTIVFPNSGAYGLSCGNMHFLSHTLPKELWVAQSGELHDISWL
ncbi:hypothetical protein [Marinicrinis lubricantis]|uniref:Orn/DAP/Arg decarboxylase 2 N-terminal domain-containing protein n=1 Tax=Marinicrinis lubricantis TaxID=2086470 RepID=A0ABW1IRS4_9BACL